jgi:hypothetical protein
MVISESGPILLRHMYQATVGRGLPDSLVQLRIHDPQLSRWSDR